MKYFLPRKALYATGFAFITASVMTDACAQESYKGKIGKTLATSEEWWPAPVSTPKDAPNIVWILLDDVGFGASSAFGGLISTPTFDSLAANGLKYTNFHTCAICAPTRAALLTGRNSASVHVSGFSHTMLSAGFPGWDGKIPAQDATVAELLKEYGYNTFAVGKYGVTPDEDATDAGPFDRWPSGKGFEHFYGFLGSQTDQYKPDLVEDNAHIQPTGNNLNEDITTKAIFYIDRQKKAAPGKPFFLYYAPGATHAPFQVPNDWLDLYKGKFDDGWDAYREQVIANQKKIGIIPQQATLPENNPGIVPWNTLSPEQKKTYARFMEVYASYLTYIDAQIGKLVGHLKDIGQLDNTMIFLMIGDNGASKEGSYNGVLDRGPTARQLTDEDAVRDNLQRIDLIGTPQGSQTNYPLGWAQACNTPFRYWKQDAHSEGGTRNPLIIFYPKGIKDKGGTRNQYSHVIDILPTTLEYIGIKAPQYLRGIKQDSIQGHSLVYSFNNATAASKHTEQYYYIFGSRAIYKDGWKAATYHHPDFIDERVKDSASLAAIKRDFSKDVWQLYNMNEDFNEQNDLSVKYPDKLKALQALFDADATKYGLYPMIDWDDVLKRRIHKNGVAVAPAGGGH
ncbi:arylsulfatase [Panacibacter sp. DH6]|uniref:Arylsulfatase n=1 Tax=Panacibacter microcysteis TaxID=2793269 RepID=A0A931MDA3_9BACT|nr:arylsulfatase [Panacibacter microcysteis]MBG9378263.1 arylsulfatase [Panacibacter microcysteis]